MARVVALLGSKARLADFLSKPFLWGQTWVIATWHPSYALRVQNAARQEEIVSGIAQAMQMGWQLANAPTADGA